MAMTACGPPAPDDVTFAFVGDSPYGTAAMASYPSIVDSIDADPEVAFVAHAGDVRGGDTDCRDDVLRRTFELYQQFDDPFWYTPGDNEWTDCHRLGGYLPTERLAFLRQLFFPRPGSTTGGLPLMVTTQAASGDPATAAFVEHTMFDRECATFGTVHVVGSRDGAEPWASYPGDPAGGRSAGDQPDLRIAELTARRAAAVAWIDRIFDQAAIAGSDAVFVMMQAEPSATDPEYAAVRERLLARAAAFDGPVMLGHGDQHTYVLTPDYGGVAGLTRLQVPGEPAAVDRWLRVTVRCGDEAGFDVETVVVGG
ncbi:MAG: hypothetical protein ACK5CE_19635 [Actinomycetes bacterium]